MSIYREHFGLTADPFHVTPDPSMLLLTRSHKAALGAIGYGLLDRKGFIVVTGEVGTGKTTVLRACLDALPEDRNRILYIFEPKLSTLELYRTILSGLTSGARLGDEGVYRDVLDSLRLGGGAGGGAQQGLLLTAIHRLLLAAYQAQVSVILAVDEAQHMSAETLESLRLLSNLETSRDKLLQIVLIGQPELEATLRQHNMRQLDQRIAARARISALGFGDSVRYIRHRLETSGWAGERDLFSRPALWYLAWKSGGVPRRLNIYADNALVNGFGAAFEGDGRGVRRIGLGLARMGVRGVRMRRHGRGAGWAVAGLACVLAVVVAGVGSGLADRLPVGAAVHADLRRGWTAAREALLPVAAQAPVAAAVTPAAVTEAAPVPVQNVVVPGVTVQGAPVQAAPVQTASVEAAPGPAAVVNVPLPVAATAPVEVPAVPVVEAAPQAGDAAAETGLRRVVAMKDSLTQLCVQVYGQCPPRVLRAVIRANGLDRPDMLFKGQVLTFPPASAID